MSNFEDELRERLRSFMIEHGEPVEFDEHDSYHYPGEKDVSLYGWRHIDAFEHVRGGGCRWVIAPEAHLVERSYAQFADTVSDNDDEVGVNVAPASCVCGKYQQMHLRYVGSLGSVLRYVLSDQNGIPV